MASSSSAVESVLPTGDEITLAPLITDSDVHDTSAVQGAPQFIPQIHLGIWRNPDLIYDIAKPTDVHINTFITHTMRYNDYTGRTLWGMLNESMGNWPEAYWSAFQGAICEPFRAYLNAHGLFVPPGRGGKSNRNCIIEAIKGDFHTWTADDIEYWTRRNADFKKRTKADPDFLYDIQDLDPPALMQPPVISISPKPRPATVAQFPKNPASTLRSAQQPRSAAAQDAMDRGVPFLSSGTTLDHTPAIPTPRPRQFNELPTPNPWHDTTSDVVELPVRTPAFDLSKKLADLSKMYDSKMKWRADTFDVFDNKFKIFKDLCQKVGIPRAYMN
jgi:hypothetical protein